ncbi:hypothetical protein EAW55_09025 [Legionella jordanis]|nr:hypothetical protein EAW55_09025 [Legionella jordanis]RMX15745.1 hypothetical protein EAS68_11550 [Legionella jordanis]
MIEPVQIQNSSFWTIYFLLLLMHCIFLIIC